MFRNSYQNGPTVEVFDSKVNRDKNEHYRELCKANKEAAARKVFDKELKSFLVELEGYGNKLCFPRDDSKQLGLMQNYLVLQLYIYCDHAWSLQFAITDTTKTKRRLSLSAIAGRLQKKFFHARCHYQSIRKQIWLNLAINVHSFMAAFKSQSFRSLDQIAVGAHCKLRRIFTMKERLIEISNEDDMYADRHTFGVYVPKQYAFPPGVLYANQVLDFQDGEEGGFLREAMLLPPIKKVSEIRNYEINYSEPRLESKQQIVDSSKIQRKVHDELAKEKLAKELQRKESGEFGLELRESQLVYGRASRTKQKEELPNPKSNRTKSKDKKKFKPKEQLFLSDLEQTKSGLSPFHERFIEERLRNEAEQYQPEKAESRAQRKPLEPGRRFSGGEVEFAVKESKKRKREAARRQQQEVIEQLDEWEQREEEGLRGLAGQSLGNSEELLSLAIN